MSLKKMILFFEKYSIIQTLFLFNKIRKAKMIYFHKRAFPPINQNPYIKSAVKIIILFFNRDAIIKSPPADKVNEFTWITNKKAAEAIDNISGEIKNNSIYVSVLKIIGDTNILKYYKMRLADYFSARILFFRIAEELIRHEKDKFYIVPSTNDNTLIKKRALEERILYAPILLEIRLANFIKNLVLKTFFLFVLLLLPSMFIFLNLKRVTFRKIRNRKYDLAMPVIWGFHDGDIIIDGVKWSQDDSYLYSSKIIPGQIIHIFNFWRNNSNIEERYKANMSKKGLHYIDSREYKITSKFLFIALKIQLKIIQQAVINLFFLFDKIEVIDYSCRMLNSALKKYLEFENVDYKVELMLHDYAPSHIIETILCNQNNKKTVGIQHNSTAGPYVLNNLCFIHFDKYSIFSQRHLELYFPFWNRLHIEKTGNFRADMLLKMSNDRTFASLIKDRLVKIYGNKKYNILILFPDNSEYSLLEKWDEIYESLLQVKSISCDFNVFLRFRSEDALEKNDIKRFKELPLNDKRLIIDHINFSSYELMLVSNVIIVSSHSSAMIDAVCLGKKVFTFDYMGTTKYCFDRYGKDIILNNKEQLLKIFYNLENNFSGYDCKWELLKKEYNYFYEGGCLDRLQQVVVKTIDEVL